MTCYLNFRKRIKFLGNQNRITQWNTVICVEWIGRIITGFRNSYGGTGRTVWPGIRFKTKTGETKSCLLRYELNFGKKKQVQDIVICYLSDISHLYDSIFYWGYYKASAKEKSISHLYKSKGKLKEYDNLISEEEKAILILKNKGLTNKQVAEQLSIDVSLIGAHRKKMLNKTGAKDLTSLFQICKMCEVF